MKSSFNSSLRQESRLIIPITFALLFLTSLTSRAQSDTLLINNEKVVGTVREISEDAVKFTYPGEDVINTVYKNTVQKITFRNGRVQTFFEATSFKPVNCVEDFDNVSLTAIESEVKGLFKLREVSSKAKGATTLSNQERVKDRAYRKMKIEAAMMGANIIYLTDQRTEGNKFGGKYQSGSSTETSLSGVAYTNRLPEYEKFLQLVNSEKYFTTIEQYKMWSSDADYSKSIVEKELTIDRIVNENGIITIEGQLAGEKGYNKFKLASFTDDYFTIFYQDKKTLYNYKILF